MPARQLAGQSPYQTRNRCTRRITTSARNLHNIPDLLQTSLPTIARTLSIVRPAHQQTAPMPIPTRLANDGWWLCESPPLAPLLIAHHHLHRGTVKMPSFAPPIPDVRPAQTNPFASRFAIALGLFTFGPFRLIHDAAGSLNVPALASGFVVWFVPIVLGGVFAALFASANPLIEKWFAQLNPSNTASQVNLARVLFWLVALSIVWPFIHVRWRPRTVAAKIPADSAADESVPSVESNSVDFFGVATVL